MDRRREPRARADRPGEMGTGARDGRMPVHFQGLWRYQLNQ